MLSQSHIPYIKCRQVLVHYNHKHVRHRLIWGCAVAGRKKRRAARGRTDVGEQPYEDPNMQMVLHQPQDSFSQQFVQVGSASTNHSHAAQAQCSLD